MWTVSGWNRVWMTLSMVLFWGAIVGVIAWVVRRPESRVKDFRLLPASWKSDSREARLPQRNSRKGAGFSMAIPGRPAATQLSPPRRGGCSARRRT